MARLNLALTSKNFSRFIETGQSTPPPPPSLGTFYPIVFGSTRQHVAMDDPTPVAGSTVSELSAYFTSTGQNQNNQLLNTGTFLDIPQNDGYVYFKVPETGTYRFKVKGGGGGGTPGGNGPTLGAPGVLVGGDVPLNAGDVLWLTVGLAGADGHTTNSDWCSGAGGGFSVVAKSSLSSKTFFGVSFTPLFIAAGGMGAREARFGGSTASNSSSGNGSGGSGFSSNWVNKTINGSSGGYAGHYSYGGFGGGTGSDDSIGPAGGYDGIYSGNPNSYINDQVQNQVRDDAGGGSRSGGHGSIEITKLGSSGGGPTVSGGTLYEDSTYYYRAFTENGELSISGGTLQNVELLLVGGGGSGATTHDSSGAGGGGAGDFTFVDQYSLDAGIYGISIGAGAPGASGKGNNGNATAITSLSVDISAQGGYGGNDIPFNGNVNGGNSGSRTGGLGQVGGYGSARSGGGGAGTGGNGLDVQFSYYQSTAGPGGPGTTDFESWMSATGLGSSGAFGGGGGGLQQPDWYQGPSVQYGAAGGIGGGSAGRFNWYPLSDSSNGLNALQNSGSGSGGHYSYYSSVSGNGGSGFLIVRWPK